MAPVSHGRSLGTLTAEDFRGHYGSRFRLSGGPHNGGSAVFLDVELVEVTEYPAGVPGALRAPFSVLFHGPLEPVMPQGTYRLEHEQFGGLELFIVPVGPSVPAASGEAPAAMRYEVVFG
jgi:hypothetical protein